MEINLNPSSIFSRFPEVIQRNMQLIVYAVAAIALSVLTGFIYFQMKSLLSRTWAPISPVKNDDDIENNFSSLPEPPLLPVLPSANIQPTDIVQTTHVFQQTAGNVPLQTNPKTVTAAPSISSTETPVETSQSPASQITTQALQLDTDTIPVNPLNKFYYQRDKESSSYTIIPFVNPWNNFADIYITVIKDTIRHIPEYHLEQFTNLLKQNTSFSYINVTTTFLRNDRTVLNGKDTGGLSRDYFDFLMSGILMSPLVSFHMHKSMGMPQTKQSYDLENLVGPSLTPIEKSIYENIGVVLMYCYSTPSNRKMLTGLLFDEALIYAALSLTAEEIDAPFEELTENTKYKMIRSMLDSRNAAGENVKALQAWLDACIQGPTLSDELLQKAANYFVHCGLCLPQFIGEDEKPNLDYINKHKEEFIQNLRYALYQYESEALGILCLSLAPIHAIAKGMKINCNLGNSNQSKASLAAKWNSQFHQEGMDIAERYKFYSQFNCSAQGSMNRKKLVDEMELRTKELKEVDRGVFNQKIEWLKEWISDEINGATEEQLKGFLKYTGGSTSIGDDHLKIGIQSPNKDSSSGIHFYTPIPQSHSCYYHIDIAPEYCGTEESGFNDYTKEAFFNVLNSLGTAGCSTNTSW